MPISRNPSKIGFVRLRIPRADRDSGSIGYWRELYEIHPLSPNRGDTNGLGQRPRTSTRKRTAGKPAPSETTFPPAPQTFKAKYEGGVTGYVKNNKKARLPLHAYTIVACFFVIKAGKGSLYLYLRSNLAATADRQPRQPTAAKVMGSIPVPIWS